MVNSSSIVSGSDNKIDFSSTQPFSSVTIEVYVPVVTNPEFHSVIPWDHSYVYGVVPPVGVDPILPEPPLHKISVRMLIEFSKSGGSVIVCEARALQLLASVTSTWKTPAPTCIMSLFGIPVVSHINEANGSVPPVTATFKSIFLSL